MTHVTLAGKAYPVAMTRGGLFDLADAFGDGSLGSLQDMGPKLAARDAPARVVEAAIRWAYKRQGDGAPDNLYDAVCDGLDVMTFAEVNALVGELIAAWMAPGAGSTDADAADAADSPHDAAGVSSEPTDVTGAESLPPNP